MDKEHIFKQPEQDLDDSAELRRVDDGAEADYEFELEPVYALNGDSTAGVVIGEDIPVFDLDISGSLDISADAQGFYADNQAIDIAVSLSDFDDCEAALTEHNTWADDGSDSGFLPLDLFP